MPISKYYAGHGDEVMANMRKQYGPEKAKRVFYATANKHGEGLTTANQRRRIRKRRRKEREEAREREYSRRLFPRSRPVPASTGTRYKT